jgi:hypothetical protein
MFTFRSFCWVVLVGCRNEEGLSKNWKIDVIHYTVEEHHPLINCYIVEVVDTFKAMVLHRLPFADAGPHLLFQTPTSENSNL